MKANLIIVFSALLLVACGGPGKSYEEEVLDDGTWSTFHKEVKLGKGSTFYKELTNNLTDTISVDLFIQELNRHMFDVNVIEKSSFEKYENTGNLDDLVVVHKMRDVYGVDTALMIPAGTYMFTLQNYANPDTITLNMSLGFPD